MNYLKLQIGHCITPETTTLKKYKLVTAFIIISCSFLVESLITVSHMKGVFYLNAPSLTFFGYLF